MIASRSSTLGKPFMVKRRVSEIAHVLAPLKGLDLSTAKTTGDPLTAPILSNWVLDEDKITCRPGTKQLYDLETVAIEALVPFYGFPVNMCAATNGKLVTMGGVALHSGFQSNDWSWVSFVNLGAAAYTLMANGKDGVWSWNGGTVADSAAVTVTNLSKTNPAVCTVAAADISKFANGQIVLIAGAVGTGLVNANGYHSISSVNVPVNTFVLTGVDCSAGAAAQTTGLTAIISGSLVKETVTAPVGTMPWFNVNDIHIVLTHQNRVFFADQHNLTVYYLPIQQKSGEVKQIPVNQLFKRGGTIRAVYTWTIDGGNGMDDKLCIFSSNNEVAIYSGTDPDTDFQLVGVFRFDSPMSKHCVANWGGELHVLVSSGLIPMSTMIRAESEQLGQSEKNVVSAFTGIASRYRLRPGWSVQLDYSTGRMICNLPLGAPNRFQQMVRKMSTAKWTQWDNLPSRCWQWLDNRLYIGTDDGKVLEVSPSYLNDNGAPIRVDVQPAWSKFKTPAYKDFKMIRPYILTDGVPYPFVDIKVDYEVTPPANQPDVSFSISGADWDTGTWDVDNWASGISLINAWNGTAAGGNVGAPRLVAFINNCSFSVSGFDVLYEVGSVMG
jgi:hypothetical protein